MYINHLKIFFLFFEYISPVLFSEEGGAGKKICTEKILIRYSGYRPHKFN